MVHQCTKGHCWRIHNKQLIAQALFTRFYCLRLLVVVTKYKLNAESRKLRALESRGAQRSSTATTLLRPPRQYNSRTFNWQGVYNLFRAMATRARNLNSVHLKRVLLSRWEVEWEAGGGRRQWARLYQYLRRPLGDSAQRNWNCANIWGGVYKVVIILY